MGTILERYQELRGRVESGSQPGSISLDTAWGYGELVYRISVLQSCQMYSLSAPVTMDVKVLQRHYQMLDAYVQSLSQERRYGPDRGPDTQKERDAAQNNLGRVINDYRKRFSSFKPTAPTTYSQEINRMVTTLLPAWLAFRNTFIPIKKDKKEAPES